MKNSYKKIISAIITSLLVLSAFAGCSSNSKDMIIAVPLKTEDAADGKMEIGYIIKKETVLSSVGELYIKELRKYLNKAHRL